MGVTLTEKEIEVVARVCHEANRAYCTYLEDFSQVPWDLAPDWQKSSCIDGVKFRINNSAAPAKASHENWSKHKVADGWKYGPVKDPEKKEHPCLVPFEELPFEQQVKDHMFLHIVNAFLNAKEQG